MKGEPLANRSANTTRKLQLNIVFEDLSRSNDETCDQVSDSFLMMATLCYAIKVRGGRVKAKFREGM